MYLKRTSRNFLLYFTNEHKGVHLDNFSLALWVILYENNFISVIDWIIYTPRNFLTWKRMQKILNVKKNIILPTLLNFGSFFLSSFSLDINDDYCKRRYICKMVNIQCFWYFWTCLKFFKADKKIPI